MAGILGVHPLNVYVADVGFEAYNGAFRTALHWQLNRCFGVVGKGLEGKRGD